MFVIALGLVVAACRGDSASRADRAAGKVVDKTSDLQDLQQRRLQNAAGDIKEVAKRARDVTEAHADFAESRLTRLDVLRVQHQIIASLPPLLGGLASIAPLTETGRADVNEKLQVLQMRLDETGNQIQELSQTDADGFRAKDDAVSGAMKRLEEARDAAFKALDDAPRVDRSS
jgi:hypothetical protein